MILLPLRFPSGGRLALKLMACLAVLSAALAHAATDVVIYGATPGGIVTAVGAARQGLSVVLVHHHAHIGGMMANGLGVMDTIYDGKRAPLYDEVCARIATYYRDKYGKDSEQYRLSQWSPRGETRRPMYEPHVAEKVFEDMLAGEKSISVVREFYPVAVKREGARVSSITFRRMAGAEQRTLQAAAFVDASYEGDLAAVAGAQMRWGREARAEYGEPHAGWIFTNSLLPGVAATSGTDPGMWMVCGASLNQGLVPLAGIVFAG
ncbi:MAG: FAD-dependent oxidoreductase, partial [Verrucomicrobiota bacterium]